jgi:hypothetical protein
LELNAVAGGFKVGDLRCENLILEKNNKVNQYLKEKVKF